MQTKNQNDEKRGLTPRVFRKVIFISLFACSSFSFTPIADWETQRLYDWDLEIALDEIQPASWPDCRGLIDPSLSLEAEYPGARRDYAINGEIPRATSEVYSYFLMAADDQGVQIKAENKHSHPIGVRKFT